MKHLIVLAVICPLLLTGQDKNTFESDLKTEKKPWTHLNFADDPNDFQFAIITDRTGGPRPGVFEDAVKKLNWLMPEFVITVGDLIRGAKGDDAETLDRQWKQHFERIAPLKMPFFHLPGNHDIKANNSFQVEYWNRKFGAAYYSFVYKDVLFLNLFTNEGTQIIGEEQVAYFTEVLNKHPDVRWTMVFMHHPLWRYSHMSNFGQIEKLLQDRNYTVFAGHQHRYHHSVKDEKNYYVLATTGGGSALLGNSFGSFDHVTWVTMSDQGPVLANLRLDGILPHDVANDETHRLTQALLRSIDVTASVLVDSPTAFREGVAYLTYRNVSEHPLHLEARFFHNHHVLAKPDAISVEIPPGANKTIPVALSSIEPFDLKEEIQIEFAGTIGYRLEDYPDLTLEGSVGIPVKSSEIDLLPSEKVEFVESYQVKMQEPLPGTEIRYTIDGSEPTGNSLKYTKPFMVSQKTTVKARLMTDDLSKMSAIDQLKLKPIEPGKGLLAAYYAYEQVGKAWGGLEDLTELAPLEIKATTELDPVKTAGRKQQFGLIYKGWIDLPEDGRYQFKARSDDAIRVLINGVEVVADPIKHKEREATGTADLTAGRHTIEIQYFQWKRNYALDLKFVAPSGEEQEVDAGILSFDKHSFSN